MSDEIYQILYCSRNSIKGTPADIRTMVAAILSASQANNKAVGVTGGLVFNSVFFAQVLEGPIEAVERTFERILRDPRHTEVTVLQTGTVEVRDFPAWSMAFASSISTQTKPLLAHTFHAYGSDPTTAGKDILALLRGVVLQQEQWETDGLSPPIG